MEEVKTALAAYGAGLDTDGFIVRDGKRLGVKIVQKRGRYRFADASGNTYATGPATAQGIKDFVEKFWFWKKVSS